jgi:hypothetical protein
MGSVQCCRTGHRASAVRYEVVGWGGARGRRTKGWLRARKADDPIAAWCKQGKAREILGTTGDVSGRSRYAFLFADDQHWKMMPCKVSSGRCATNSDLTAPRGLAGWSSAVEYRRPWSAAPPAQLRTAPGSPQRRDRCLASLALSPLRTASTAIERFPACGRCPKRITDHGSRRRQHRGKVICTCITSALVVARRDLHRPTTPWANYILYLVHRPRFSRPSSIRCGAPMARASRLPATSSLGLSRTLGICPQTDASQIVTPQTTSAATSARPGILRLDPVGLGRLRYCTPYVVQCHGR